MGGFKFVGGKKLNVDRTGFDLVRFRVWYEPVESTGTSTGGSPCEVTSPELRSGLPW